MTFILNGLMYPEEGVGDKLEINLDCVSFVSHFHIDYLFIHLFTHSPVCLSIRLFVELGLLTVNGTVLISRREKSVPQRERKSREKSRKGFPKGW